MVKSFNFDHQYYERWYRNDETRTFMKEYTPTIVKFVFSYLDYLQVEVHSVFDVGCGLGYWRRALRRARRNVRYKGLEISDYLCSMFPWEKGSIADYHSSERYDLVVCQSVLQYLDDRECSRAIQNLASLCAKALYLEVPTSRDLVEACVPEHTDMNIYARTGAWYRKRLLSHFTSLGGGLFVKKGVDLYYYELWSQE